MVSFLVLSVVVYAWSMTPKLRGQPTSVGLAPNKAKITSRVHKFMGKALVSNLFI